MPARMVSRYLEADNHRKVHKTHTFLLPKMHEMRGMPIIQANYFSNFLPNKKLTDFQNIRVQGKIFSW